MSININFNRNGDELQVNLDGRLDTTTAPELESVLNENYIGINSLVIDCENLIYVSSAGLRVLLSAHKRMKGEMKLIKVGELIMEETLIDPKRTEIITEE